MFGAEGSIWGCQWLDGWWGGGDLTRLSPHCFLQEELEEPESLMVMLHHQLEKHHHLVEASLVLCGRQHQ